MKLSEICVTRHTRHQVTALLEPRWDYSGSVEVPLKILGLSVVDSNELSLDSWEVKFKGLLSCHPSCFQKSYLESLLNLQGKHQLPRASCCPSSGAVCSCCSQKAVMGLTALVHVQ